MNVSWSAALASLFVACCPFAFALNPALDVSQYAHASWKYRDGFTKGDIEAIAQTSDGYLWLGTGFGLYRFDGVRAVSWEPPPDQALRSNEILRLLAARDGTLWIGTRDGLASWKDNNLTQYSELAGFSISALIEDREGSIWVGARGFAEGKLCEIRNSAVQCDPSATKLHHGVLALHEDPKGNLWIGGSSGVWRWKPGPPEFYNMPQTLGISALATEENGDLLISTEGAVTRLAGGKFIRALAYPGKNAVASCMLRDREGDIWSATLGSGIVHWNGGRADVFSQSDGLSSNHVTELFEDREGNIWAATDNGLDSFRELPAVSYSLKQGISGLPSGAFLASKDGSVWFGSRGVLNQLSGRQLTVYTDRAVPVADGVREIVVPGLPDPSLAAFAQDSHGRIWLSSRTSAGYLENDRFFSTAAPDGIVAAISGDRSGNMWMSYQDLGLLRLSGRNVVERIPLNKFGRSDPADALVPDLTNGGLWLGFFQGGIVWLRDGQVRASYSAKDGLGTGRVSELRFDRGGALWAATESGLSRLKDGRIATLSIKNGLPCDAVQWSIEDDAHSLWLMTPCGLVRISRSEVEAWAGSRDPAAVKIHPTVLDSSEGVANRRSAGAQSPHVAKSSDGRLWFWNLDSVGVVDPRYLPFNKLPPPVHIEQITADGKLFRGTSGQRLPALVQDLTIDYTALSFAEPEKNRFKYKLEGYDRDWHDAGNRRQAYYTNLDPRQYRFRVQASNNSGVWNEAGASLDFSIEPAYYQTGWFRAAIVAVVLGLAWGLYRLRLHQVAREYNMRLEERVNERTRVARDLHDTLLQSFQGLMLRFQVVDELLPEGKAKKELEKALERADQAMAEGRSAVFDLRSSATITNELPHAVKALGEELATQDSAAFHLVLEGESRDLHPIVRDEIYRITREALRNAFSHADANHIETEVTYGARAFRLRVRDDGKGIPAEILEEGRPGHYGLPGMRERAKQIGGKLEIWSGDRTGTEIELNIPGSVAYGSTVGHSRFRLFRKKAG
ncbi:MAG TPA: two-component regulator propeller domain-containing protein [Bryobacteraceae bacterium]